MSFDWMAWMSEKPVRRERLVGWFMAHLTTPEDMEEIVTALVLAVNLVSRERGKEIAEMIRKRAAS